MINPNIAKTLNKKIKDASNQFGSLLDILVDEKTENTILLPPIRGNAKDPAKKTFWTFIDKDLEVKQDGLAFGLNVEKHNHGNAISYLKTNVARYALSILKISMNSHRGEFKYVPLVDFNQSWNDDKLCELLSITNKEYQEILRVIPKYYD